jgi:hypothetical protein
MKKILFCLIAVLPPLFPEQPNLSYWDCHPIHIGGNAIAIGKANINTKQGARDGNLIFNKVNAFTYILVPVSTTTFFFPRFEWNRFTMDWDKNDKFNQKHFQFAQFALTCFSIAIEKWRWVSRVEFNFDLDHFSNFKQYGLFSALLWGAYTFNEKWHYHIGAFGYTGMRGEEVYPVIGFDYTWAKKWMFQVLFPINYSIEYSPNQELKLALKGRPLKERFRVGKDEPQPMSIFSYSSIGLEFNVRYEKFLKLEAEAFAGYSFGGNFYIKDKKGQNAIYTSVQGAPYIGANLNYGF